MANSCGYRQVVVTSTENSYSGIPKTIKAGVVAFKNVNKGKDAHVLNFARRRAGDTTPMADIVKAAKAAAAAGKDGSEVFGKTFEFLNGIASFAKPGETSADTLDLKPGDYILIDTAPVGWNGTGKDPTTMDIHVLHGMYVEFKVR